MKSNPPDPVHRRRTRLGSHGSGFPAKDERHTQPSNATTKWGRNGPSMPWQKPLAERTSAAVAFQSNGTEISSSGYGVIRTANLRRSRVATNQPSKSLLRCRPAATAAASSQGGSRSSLGGPDAYALLVNRARPGNRMVAYEFAAQPCYRASH